MLLKMKTVYKDMQDQNSYMIAEKEAFEILKAEVDTINIVSSKNLTS